MIAELFWLILGALVVWLSAGFVVEFAERIAKGLGISGAFIGLTVLSIGTSVPEISTAITAALDKLKGIDASGIALGTSIGSDIVQMSLIIGIVGLIAVIKADSKVIKRDYYIMMGATVLLFLMFLDGELSRGEGWVLVLLYGFYMYHLARNERVFGKILHHHRKKFFKNSCILITGLIVIMIFADMVVTNAVSLAGIWGVNQSLIGLLIIGVSTALPELTTAVRGMLQGAQGISLGTLIGSNITNPLLVIGLGAGISGFTVDPELYTFDLPFRFILYMIILYMFMSDMKLSKREALGCILLYFVYIGLKLRFLF